MPTNRGHPTTLGTPNGGTASSRRRQLDRQTVLGAALDLVDAEGLERLSMRRLAGRLGVEPMAIYRYAPGKQALLRGVVDQVLEHLDLDAAVGPDVVENLRACAWDFRRVVLGHPRAYPIVVANVFSLSVAQRSPAGLRWFERLFTILDGAGLEPDEAALAYQSYTGFLFGSLVVELRRVVEDPEEPEPGLKLGLHRLPASSFPHLRRALPLLATIDPEQAFAGGLEMVLEGLLRRFAGAS